MLVPGYDDYLDHRGRLEPRENLAGHGPRQAPRRDRGPANPEGRAHNRDLVADAQPRFHGTSGAPGSDREETSATEHATELFAKRVGEYLDKARTAHKYDRLHLVAPPAFLGQLRKELGKEVQKLVAEELPKDLSWLKTRDLQERLR